MTKVKITGPNGKSMVATKVSEGVTDYPRHIDIERDFKMTDRQNRISEIELLLEKVATENSVVWFTPLLRATARGVLMLLREKENE